MVKKIVGYADDNCTKKIFERDAREYDKSVSNTILGISIGDLVRAVPVIIACGIFYANDCNFKKTQIEFNQQMMLSVNNMNETLTNLNNYLSSTTGKQFKNGWPR